MTGVVIGSFGMPSCVALNIAAIIHSNTPGPPVPILVHDDSTPANRDPTGFFQAEHGTHELYRTPRQLGHVAGDVSTYVQGLKWAKQKGFKYLVKTSQRFIMFQQNWIEKATRLADKEQATTIAQPAAHGGWRPWGHDGIRTEFILMRVEAWAHDSIYQFLQDARVTPEVTFKVAAENHVQPTGPIPRWRCIPTDKARKMKGILWHDANPESDYADLAARLNIELANYSNAGWRDLLGGQYFMS